MRFCSVIAVVLLLLAASSAEAAIAIPKGGGEPIRGFLVRQDGTTVVLDVPRADGKLDRKTFLRGDLDAFLITVDPERLSALKPDDPKSYRNFAEELAEKKIDPEARAAALRLYLLAAYLDPKELGRGSLLGMIALARSPGEEKKFRAMAYLLDREHDRTLLAAPSATAEVIASAPAPSGGPAKEDRVAILRALQLYRQGKPREAANILQPAHVKASFQKLGAEFDYEEFLAACKASGRAIPKPEVLAKALLLELALSDVPAAAPLPDASPMPKPVDASKTWSATADGDQAPAPSLRLETITEFDPRQTVYRDGKWTTP